MHYRDPYRLKIENTTDKVKKAIIFGFSKFAFTPNFGSDEGIKITNEGNSSYTEILSESAFFPFNISCISIVNQNIKSLKSTILEINHSKGDGRKVFYPIHLKEFYSESQIIYSKIILQNYKYKIHINSSSFISININPFESYILDIFHEKYMI